MSGAQWQVAQVNIGRTRGAIHGPIMAQFVAMLAEINAVAEQTPGFVWRLQTEDGDATSIRPYADERIMINMSVWADLESLRGYVFRSAHAAVMRRRREWFERFEGIYVALWWVPVGYRPTAEEAVTRWLTSRRTVPRRLHSVFSNRSIRRAALQIAIVRHGRTPAQPYSEVSNRLTCTLSPSLRSG